tara:strand:- start:1126 stop:1848 length:723 start_codon:yes stop_codon:yes gene_type:complete
MDFFYDKIPYVLGLGGIFAMGLLFSCTVVGRVLRDDEIRDKIITKENAEKMKKRLEQKRYERSFYDELEAVEKIDLTKEDMEKLHHLYITEDTPIEKIKMCYSCDTETFWYYSKNKHIPYQTLDAVARKYAVKHNCAQICVNYCKEVEKVMNKNATLLEKSSETDEAKVDQPSIYVKLKSYNKTSKENKKAVTVERSNRFTYKGTIEDIEKHVNDENKSDMKKISFEEYKKKMESQKKNA